MAALTSRGRIILVTNALYVRLVAPAYLQAQVVCQRQGGREAASTEEAADAMIHACNACSQQLKSSLTQQGIGTAKCRDFRTSKNNTSHEIH